MKKILLTTVFQISFLAFLFCQNQFYIQKDMTGLSNASSITSLESAAKGIDDILPDKFKGKFKVYDYSLFVHITSITGGIQATIAAIKEKIKNDNTNGYYLLIIRENTSDEFSKKVNIFTKLPTSDEFSCNNDDLIKIIEQSVTVAISNGLNNKYNYPYHYASAEEKGINVLKNHFISLLNCCKNNTTPCICPTADEIKAHFISRKYFSIPINIDPKPLVRPSDNSGRNSQIVEDYAQLSYEEADGGRIYLALDLEEDLNKFTQQGINPKAYITKNENFCDNMLKKKIDQEFLANTLQYGVHYHLWKDENKKQDVLFVKYFPFINTDTVKLSDVEIKAPYYPCSSNPLPNVPLDYAVHRDLNKNKFFGYHRVNGNWVQSDSVEYTKNISPNDTQLERVIANQGATRTQISTYTDPGGISVPVYSYFPSKKAYEYSHHPNVFSTNFLVNYTFSCFAGGGNGLGIIAPYYDDFSGVFHHFKYNKGNSLKFNCDSKISKGLYDLQYFKSANPLNPQSTYFIQGEIIPQVKVIFSDWLKTHENFDAFFVPPSAERTKLDNLTLPYLGSAWQLNTFWIYAIVGGMQGYKVGIRNFKKFGKCYEIDIIVTVKDVYGFGNDDGGRFLPGLIEGWVLQHYRNYDNSYCPNPPCFYPIVDFSIDMPHKLTICND